MICFMRRDSSIGSKRGASTLSTPTARVVPIRPPSRQNWPKAQTCGLPSKPPSDISPSPLRPTPASATAPARSTTTQESDCSAQEENSSWGSPLGSRFQEGREGRALQKPRSNRPHTIERIGGKEDE